MHFQQLDYSLLFLQTDLLWELNIKFNNQVSFLLWFAVNWHSLPSDNSSRLRGNDLIEMKLDKFSIKLFLNQQRSTIVTDLDSRASIRLILAV